MKSALSAVAPVAQPDPVTDPAKQRKNEVRQR